MNMVEQVTDYVKNYDEEVGKAIELELGRQRRKLYRQINTQKDIRARDIMGVARM